MIGPIKTALKAKLAEVATWPVRWANGPWPDGTVTSDGNMPVNGDGAPVPAIEAEIIGGPSSATIGPKGKRRGALSGLLRVYLSVGQGTGDDDITAQADAIDDAFKRVTVWSDPATAMRLLTMDPRIDDGVAAYEEGDRYCRMISIPWDFDYPN